MKKQFDLKHPIIGDILPEIRGVSEECINDVLKMWEVCRKAMNTFPGRNNSECNDFVLNVLHSLPNVENVWYERDNCVPDTAITGLIDFGYVASKGLYSPILCILQAKDIGIVQGRAQNYVQLLSCYDLAQKSYCRPMFMVDQTVCGVSEKQLLKNFLLCMYGVVSTVKEWIFVRFDGKEWLETDDIHITPDFKEEDKESVRQVATIL